MQPVKLEAPRENSLEKGKPELSLKKKRKAVGIGKIY